MKTREMLDDVLLSVERLKAYNEVIDETISTKIDGKGLNGVNILYAMTTIIFKELKELNEKLSEIYKNSSI